MEKLIVDDIKIDVIIADIPYDEVSSLGAERQKYKGQLRKLNKDNADIITFNWFLRSLFPLGER